MRTSAYIKAQDVEMGGSRSRRRLVPDSWSTSTFSSRSGCLVSRFRPPPPPSPRLRRSRCVPLWNRHYAADPETSRGWTTTSTSLHFSPTPPLRPLICHAPLLSVYSLATQFWNSVHLFDSSLSLSLARSLRHKQNERKYFFRLINFFNLIDDLI